MVHGGDIDGDDVNGTWYMVHVVENDRVTYLSWKWMSL